MNETKLKILILADAASFHTERYIEELNRQGCIIRLLSLEKGTMPFTALKRRGSIKSLHYYFSVKQIKKEIEDFKPDLISAHFASGYGFTAALANKNYNLPLIVNVWGSDILIVPHKSFLHRRKTRYALSNADYVIGDSNYLLTEVKKLTPIEQSMTVPWGIEQKHLSLHKNNYHLSRPLKILVPRPHEIVYNNLFIVESLASLINENKIELTFPAFGSLYDDFKNKTSKVVGDKIRYYQKKDRSEFLKYFASHDVYLSASQSDSSPVSLIEAMALGLIPIAADIDGVKEWLNRQSGFLFKQNDQQSLINCILDILDSDDTFFSMRQSNLKKVTNEAVFEKNIADQITVMRKLVERGSHVG